MPGRLLVGTVAVGIAFRACELLHDRSLWRDEASLVFNLRTRGILGFTEPLDHDQAAPAGFFVLAQSVGRLLGGSEMAYRAVPFLASCLSLVIAAVLARRHLRAPAAVLAAGILACSPTLLYYAAEVKQYSVDMATTLVVWLVADAAARRRWSLGSLVLLAAVGAVAITVSYPAVFVLPPIGLVAVLDARDDRRSVRRLVLVGATWTVVLAATYLAWVRELNDSDFLREFWAPGFLPLVPTSGADLEQWGSALRTLYTQLLTAEVLLVVVAVSLVGMVVLARRSTSITIVLAGPVVLAVIASSAGLYPVIERSLLFALPGVAVAIGAGADAIGRALSRRDPVYLWLPAGLIGILAFTVGAARAVEPPDQEELRPLLRSLAGTESDATVLVTDTAEVAWHYYAGRLGLHPGRVIVEDFARRDPVASRSVVDDLPRGVPVWVVDVAFWRPVGELDPDLVRALDRAGTRVDARHATGASVYVYELDP